MHDSFPAPSFVAYNTERILPVRLSMITRSTTEFL